MIDHVVHLLVHLTPDEAYVLFTHADDPNAMIDVAVLVSARSKVESAYRAYVERKEREKDQAKTAEDLLEEM